MKDGPNIARIAALIGDHARAEVLTALMADRALTATELANLAGVSKPTMSAHLAKLLDAGLIAGVAQGRHRYFRLADADVARLLEALMGVAFRAGAVRVRSSPREPALRKARVCYDHLAGELGVKAYETLLHRGKRRGAAPDRGRQELVRRTGNRCGGRCRTAAPPVPPLPGLERAPPSPRRRLGRAAAATPVAVGLGQTRPGLAGGRIQRQRRARAGTPAAELNGVSSASPQSP
ncbi:ArsR/SmtB family transcription factor [Pseudomonas sp. PDM15]|uniref:ArsR/SmtB family transcription factor n=1 Tax=Pseudomonas sp. PDM15 TaxID=2769303 RepID=UPI001CE0A72D|nr:helix-turn-helix domain-containing protein [Pseudomonas sp. PDM15]